MPSRPYLPLCSLDNVAGFGHYARVSALLDDFARRHPNDAVWVGSEWFVSAERVVELIGEAQALGVRVLGLEGFLIGEGATYPALSRIADFSYDTPAKAAQQACELLVGSWANAPTPSDQMNSRATGRYMVAVVLDD